VTAPASAAAPPLLHRVRRPTTVNLRRYLLPAIGAAIILLWIIVIVVGPAFAADQLADVDVRARLKPPSGDHWFGTDELGRDIFGRVLRGARITLPVGITVVVLGGLIGVIFGSVAAYAGHRVEEGMMRIADLVLSFPALILAMAIAAALGIGITNAIIAMVSVWWPQYARLSRSLVLTQREQEYVHAAQVVGCSAARTLFRHIVPNIVGSLVVLLTLDIGTAIVTFAGLSFLGLGVPPPTPEWGAMVAAGRLLIDQWWVSGFPGLAIFTVVIAFNFLGDGIRDWLDPRSR
jgi:peptide/nickel transport system permease protein